MTKIIWRCFMCGWRAYDRRPHKCDHCGAGGVAIGPVAAYPHPAD